MSDQKKRGFWSEPVNQLPLQHPPLLKKEDTLEDAIRAMQDSKLGCVFIVDDKNGIQGIFTDRDVMEHYVSSSVVGDTQLEQFLPPELFVIDYRDTVLQAVERFHENQIRHLPVVDEDKGEIKGLLSVRVLMDFLAENLPKQVLNLPPNRNIVAKEADGA